MAAFKDDSWGTRFKLMGDASEAKFVEHCGGKCERFGLNRPEGVYVPKLPARVRAAPDFVTDDGFVECLGLGRAQQLQMKDEKLGVLRFWRMVMPVRLFIWDSYRKRKCVITLEAFERLINTPGVVSIDYFDDRKLVLKVPADFIFEASDG